MRSPRLSALALPALLLLAGCGEGVDVAKNSEFYDGARLFDERCSGCHTFDVAGTQGSSTKVHSREYKDGPNFNQRKEEYDQVLYAIRNGGYSSGPMPQNIVTGEEAEAVARFVERYSGRE